MNGQLLTACCIGQLDLVNKLLSQGVDPNIREKNKSPLLCASSKGHVEVVKALLSVPDIDPNITTIDDVTPLHRASSGGHLEVVRELLTAPSGGADPNIVNEYGNSPLHWAVRNGYLEIVKELLRVSHGGADTNAVNELDNTPLSIASRNERSEIAELLNNYIPSFQSRCIVSIRENRIKVSKVPKLLFSS